MKTKILLLSAFILIVFANPLAAQDIPKINLAGVTVQGNTTASEMIIKVNSGFIEGAVLTGDDIQEGIQKLWRLKLFKDVKIILEKETSAGAFIIIMVEEYPRLAKVEYSGNKKIKTKELEKDIPFIRGQVINPHTINRATQKIEEKYAEKSYYNAKVDVSTEPGAVENTIIVNMDIIEGKKVRIRDIEFEGNENFSDFRLRWQMKEIKQRKWWKLFTDGKLDEEKFEEDKLNVLQFYRDHGYRDARFTNEEVLLSEDGKSIFLKLTLDEGIPYYFGNINVTGNTIYSTDYLMKSLESVGISRGTAYKEKSFESGVDLRVRSLYLDHGYLYAQVVPELTPRDKDTLDLTISIVENNKVFIRRIDIVGNDRTRDFVIRREMRIFPGDVFNREALIRSQSDIFRLNYFGNVIPEIVPVDDENIDLEIIVEEKSSDRANVAIAYSELDGFVGSIGLDIANFRGSAQRVSTEYRRGAAYEYLSLGFTEPWLMGRPNTVGANLYYSSRGNSASYYYYYDLGVKGITAHFGRRFRWPDSYFRGTWSITFSQKTYSNYENNELIFLLHNPTGLEKTNANRLSQVIARDSRNRPEFPTGGSTVRLTSSLNGGLLGGHEEFVKNHFKSEWYMGLVEKLVLYQNYEMGIINTFGKYSVIPYDERFYM
ncbi:MAG TPA: outer membrane protein assembly factor BamA, partial [Candidatus Marinimicrobia bacterium]|nr:outer membrane protein assembly factor BamA [Candidatus Neomarinimicrobiota bacterium]